MHGLGRMLGRHSNVVAIAILIGGSALGLVVPARALAAAATASAGGPSSTPRAAPVYLANGFACGCITGFAAGAQGDAAPTLDIRGSATGLISPSGIALDLAGRIFVADARANSVSVFAPNANGDVAPVRTIAGAATGLNSPAGIALDGAGHLFVVNAPFSFSGPPPPPSVTEYASDAHGDATPLATITGPATQLTSPFGIALEGTDVFVATLGGINVYPSGATGNVAPSATIAGASTRLSAPNGLAIHAGLLYAANSNNTVTAYPLALLQPGANDLPPTTDIGGPHTGIDSPQGITVDASGRIDLVDEGSPGDQQIVTLTEYGPTANLDTAPLDSLDGPANLFDAFEPFWVAVKPLPPSSDLAVATAGLPTGTAGQPYSAALAATGGEPPYRWSLSGALPHGLSLNGADGIISGTPPTDENSAFTAIVTDSDGRTASRRLAVAVSNPVALRVTSGARDRGEVGVYLDAAIDAVGGVAPYTCSVTTGSLPAGLTQDMLLDPSGCRISGVPTAQGSVTVTVTITDSSSPAEMVSQPVTFAIQGGETNGPSGTIYLANYNTNSVLEFSARATGDAAPIRQIVGEATRMHGPGELSLAPDGSIIVANFSSVNTIEEYAPCASGNAKPVRFIGGPRTGLDAFGAFGMPGLGVDAAGDVWTGMGPILPNAPGALYEFAAGAHGDVPPIRTIAGPHTGLVAPSGIAFDARGDIWVANFPAATLEEFAPDASGDAAPIATIELTGTPLGIVFDHAQNMYVDDKYPDQVLEFSPDHAGVYHQVRAVAGPATGLDGEVSYLAIYRDATFVTQFRDTSVSEFSADANGNVSPIHRIAGPDTVLASPGGIAVGPSICP